MIAAVLVALALSQAPDAGALEPWPDDAKPGVDHPKPDDAPLSSWSVVPKNTVLLEDAVCAPAAVAVSTAKGIAQCRAERDAAVQEVQSGGGATVKWAMVSLAIGFAAGGLAAAVGVCAAVGCVKR